MYLFERGKESASFLADVIRSKGQYAKEGRVFQSRMRFDFEVFVNMFVSHLQRQAEMIGKMFNTEIRKELKEFRDWLIQDKNDGKGYTYANYAAGQDRLKSAFIGMAINDLDEADRLMNSIERVKQAREAQKGGGIYVDKAGRPYSVNDPDIDEIIKADREMTKEAENDAD